MKTFLIFLILFWGCNQSYSMVSDGHSAAHTKENQSSDFVKTDSSMKIRLEGETIENAFLIELLPFYDFGSTEGYQDNYEFSCPHTSPAPDVIYQYEPEYDQIITIDLCGSQFDTEIFVFDDEFNLISCSNDFYVYPEPCGQNVSRIQDCQVFSGENYYIAVDGYYASAGAYELNIWESEDCSLDCSFSVPEGEPELFDGYTDNYNGGCNSGVPVFQNLQANSIGEVLLCGVGGWYQTDWQGYGDTDWFEVTAGSSGTIEVYTNSEYLTKTFFVNSSDCSVVDIISVEFNNPCQETHFVYQGDPGSNYWIVVVTLGLSPPQNFEGQEFNYLLKVTGLESGFVSTDKTTFGGLKAQYRDTAK